MINNTPLQAFNYNEAFSRNIGWLTTSEQLHLKQKCVAIAGMGGVGGAHLLTLIRLGISHFKIADFDHFETVNFNRQVGATTQTLGQPKVEVLRQLALDINPDAKIECFEEGLNAENISHFLQGVDLFIDGLDFFQVTIRELVFATCHDMHIPAITAAPLGMGCAYLIFLPQHMSFEDYFQFRHKSEAEKLIHFLIGLSPKAAHRHYLMDPSTINLEAHKGPSTFMACQLCAGITGVEALKILVNRGNVYAAPYYQLFDAYQQVFVRKKLWFGNQNPIQKYKAFLMKRALKNKTG